MYYGAKTCQFKTLIQCVCVLDCQCRTVNHERSIRTFLPLYQACRTQNRLRVKSEVQLGTLGCHILDVSKMLGQSLAASSLYQNNFISMYAF